MEVLNWEGKIFQPRSSLKHQLYCMTRCHMRHSRQGSMCDLCIQTHMMKLFCTPCWYSVRLASLSDALDFLVGAHGCSDASRLTCLRENDEGGGRAGWGTYHDTHILRKGRKKKFKRNEWKPQGMTAMQKRTICPKTGQACKMSQFKYHLVVQVR